MYFSSNSSKHPAWIINKYYFPNGQIRQIICELQNSWAYFIHTGLLCTVFLCWFPAFWILFLSPFFIYFLILLKYLIWLFPRKGSTGSKVLSPCRLKNVFVLSSHSTESSAEYKILNGKFPSVFIDFVPLSSSFQYWC